MTDRIIVISDIHNRVAWIESFLSSIDYDKVIFLGDYFDDFDDTLEDTEKAANWLKESLKESNRIHLMGNHEMWYRFMNPNIRASGNTEWKYNIINDIITNNEWDSMNLYYLEQGYLLSHAGLHQYVINNLNIPIFIKNIFENVLNIISNKAFIDIKNGKENILFGVGKARYGNQIIGGITWLDWDNEFEPIPYLNQIVGHTQHNIPKEKKGKYSKNYCIDVKNNYYGILEDNIFTYRKISGKYDR